MHPHRALALSIPLSFFAVWQEHTSSTNDEIYYRLNTNGTWGSNQNLSNTSGLSQYPYISGFKPTSSTDTALVMWAEKPSGGNYDIYYKLLTRSVKQLTNTSATSTYPAFACKNSTNRLLAVWTEGNSAQYAVADTTLGSSSVLSTSRMRASLDVDEREMPYQYSLEQNYPNPLNPTTEIRFTIPEAAFVHLIVYDILGQEVAVIVNEMKEQGKYSINWDCENCPSGVYFYRLQARSFLSTKKMLLLR
ncbi:MAG: T9SS type A sorting domain-containing protein [Ignavibacteriae bacterium]|nr:T9SS type A sorting domain-containing protein [Ignavibacteria bacterium]MBI3364682.1 T9SS type A sorting domain-containing protein [Ignavibacteriota bacterium]